MDAGRLRLGLTMLGSWARATHEGRPGDGFSGSEHQIKAGWGSWRLNTQIAAHPRFAVELGLPLRLTSVNPSVQGPDGRTLDTADTIHRRQVVVGLGDLRLATRFGIVRNEDVRGWVADVQFGVSLPTGRASPNAFGSDESTGLEQPSLGSGTVDPIYGLASTYNVGRWGMTGWASARIPLVNNRFGNRASRVVSASVGPFSGFGLVRWRFVGAPELFVATPAKWDGRDAPNSDRIALMATAGAFFQPKPRLSFNATVKLPVFTHTTGGELLWPVIGMLGISYTFALTPEEAHHHD